MKIWASERPEQHLRFMCKWIKNASTNQVYTFFMHILLNLIIYWCFDPAFLYSKYTKNMWVKKIIIMEKDSFWLAAKTWPLGLSGLTDLLWLNQWHDVQLGVPVCLIMADRGWANLCGLYYASSVQITSCSFKSGLVVLNAVCMNVLEKKYWTTFQWPDIDHATVPTTSGY